MISLCHGSGGGSKRRDGCLWSERMLGLWKGVDVPVEKARGSQAASTNQRPARF